jgi:HAD superfamily hydrolase (TIGR01509 family)
MQWIHNYQLFLFDFDGLLVNTEPLHYAAYLEMSRRRGCPLNWDYQRFSLEAHSKPMGFFDGLEREYPSVFKEGPSRAELYEEKKRIYLEMLSNNSLSLMEGAGPLLDVLDLHQIKSAVVTNSPRNQIALIKRALPQLEKISLWLTREDYVSPKPSPEGYLKAISLMGSPGDRIIGFEDSLKGLKGLIASGAESVLICPADHEHVEEGKALGAKHFSTLSSVFNSD